VTWGVAFAWHVHPWEALLDLVRRAEALGYAAAFVDGDVSMLGVRADADALDGWTVTTALLTRTRRIPIGSMRLVEHWNAARLAQAAATAERIAPGRLRFVIAIGDREIDARFGFPRLSPAERMAWLDETLTAVRALWRGEAVTLHGRYVELEGARVRPTPPGGRIPIAIAARGPRMLELVAAHADVWDVNLPPVPAWRRPAGGADGTRRRSRARCGSSPGWGRAPRPRWRSSAG
jgi:alkanesulfonate monooxygenase SsuD/methylene tetrahydromethanopterin reductase-like flavin-dependent oxidoreductase (luciferase family)